MADETASPGAAPAHIDLYWRPGCGFCSMLQRKLDQLGIDRVEHNIWDDDDDAAIVRQFASGNETVPTVVIGDRGFVNPSAGELVAYLATQCPDLLPEGFEVPEPGLSSRLSGKMFG